MTRIIAGSARGRTISVPPGRDTRPTADRVREGLFSTLESLAGTLFHLRFLDLYAGSGGVGLEALSRGAAHALFIESNPRTAAVIEANTEALGLRGARVQVVQVEQLLHREAPGAPYDIVFADPPYALPDDDLRRILGLAQAGGWLSEHAILAVERATRGGEWVWPADMRADRSRRYGEATLWYGRAAGPSAPEVSKA